MNDYCMGQTLLRNNDILLSDDWGIIKQAKVAIKINIRERPLRKQVRWSRIVIGQNLEQPIIFVKPKQRTEHLF